MLHWEGGLANKFKRKLTIECVSLEIHADLISKELAIMSILTPMWLIQIAIQPIITMDKILVPIKHNPNKCKNLSVVFIIANKRIVKELNNLLQYLIVKK